MRWVGRSCRGNFLGCQREGEGVGAASKHELQAPCLGTTTTTTHQRSGRSCSGTCLAAQRDMPQRESRKEETVLISTMVREDGGSRGNGRPTGGGRRAGKAGKVKTARATSSQGSRGSWLSARITVRCNAASPSGQATFGRQRSDPAPLLPRRCQPLLRVCWR